MYALPTSKKARQDAVVAMLNGSRMERKVPALAWFVNYHYLRRARDFDLSKYDAGEIRASYVSGAGDLPFAYEEILTKYAAEIGRLMRLDIRPSVDRTVLGLMAARKASAAHVVLDTLMRTKPLDTLKKEIAQLLCLYGTCGITNWIIEEPGASSEGVMTADVHAIAVIPPWELLSIPANVPASSHLRAVCRERWLPLEEMKDKRVGQDKLSLGNEDDAELEIVRVTPSTLATEADPTNGGFPAPAPRPRKEDKKPREGAADTSIAYGLFQEVWWYSETGRLRTYQIIVGSKEVYYKDYQDLLEAGAGKVKKGEAVHRLPVMPIAVMRYTDGLGFFGRSFVEPLVTLNAEVENMIYKLIRNVQDIDQFGYTFIPANWGITSDTLKEARPGRRMFLYDPDPTAPDARLQSAQPVTTGELPGRVANLALSLMDRLAQQPSALMQGDAPGRTDSGRGLDILYQTSTVPLSGPAESIAGAMATVYGSVLWHARSFPSVQVNFMSLLDDNVVGVELDPKTGAMALGDFIPDPSEVAITIRSKEPVNLEQRKGELMAMLKDQIITPMEFRIVNRQEGYNLPTANDVEWQNYLRAVLNNIVMFGDGEKPGVIFRSNYDQPNVHEFVVLRRMASVEFSLASPAVQKKFSDRLNDIRALRGQLPDQAPYPEDAALESQQTEKNGGVMPPDMMAQLAQSGGMGGPAPQPGGMGGSQMPGPGPGPGTGGNPGLPPEILAALTGAGPGAPPPGPRP